MNTVYLLSPYTLRQYEDISINAKPERLSIFIKKAQELDLKPFLGHALYYEFLSCFTETGTLSTDAPPAYQNLFNGCKYNDRFGHNISYEGIVPTLVYFTFARFIEADAIRYTASGPVLKQLDNAATLKPRDVIKLVQQQRSVANAHSREVEKFLLDNRQQFPLWRYDAQNASARQAGPRIRGVDKTEFNYPGSTFPENDFVTLNDFIN